MSMERRIREEARLIMLKELAGQTNGRLTSTSLRNHLDEVWGINKSREWIEQEFAWLADMGAITVVAAGSVKIACLAEGGDAHVRRRTLIPGVLAPSLPVA